MPAFVGLVSGRPDAHQRFEREARARAARQGGFAKTLSAGPVSLVCDRLEIVPLLPGNGFILGRVFGRGRGEAAASIDARSSRAIAASRGASLVENVWGHYVAVLPTPDGGVDLVRAPLGALPCYLLRTDDGLFFGSSARLLLDCAKRRPAVATEALVRHLAYAHLRTRETCLTDVEELPGGERATFSTGGMVRSTLWSPWTWAVADRAIRDAAAAARALADCATECVAALAPRTVLLKLSGGLDSSIVAACLASASIPFESLTLVSDDPAGDERDYARAVARHLGAPLREVRRDPALFDARRSPARRLPRPSIPGFRQVSDAVTAAAAIAIGASAVVDGSGGDNVFCSLQSASPVADCLLTSAGRRHTLETAASIAAIAQVSMIDVLRRAAGRIWRPRRDYRWPADLDLLAAQAIDIAGGVPAHPWLHAPAGVLPGKAAHVALIAAAQSHVEGIDPEQDPPLRAPLLAQPLVELCLRIPSWLWFGQGQNRAAARQAFRGALPRHILDRRTKGTPDSFVAQLFERHRATIRAWLLDGVLAGNGLIDRAAIIALTDGRPLPDRHLHRIMMLFDAEVWARGWTE